jgi:phospholipid/cholesterol/gamma-HCH transport system substrate-binding protein
MKRTSLELTVGVFVCIGMLAVGYLTIKLGRMEMFQSESYLVSARFQNVAGLKSGSSVEIAGVPVGRVSAIKVNPENFAAIVEMKIDKGVALTDDTIASVKTQGLIGDKYIKLSPGGSDKVLQPGETMLETESAVDIEELISKYVMGKV